MERSCLCCLQVVHACSAARAQHGSRERCGCGECQCAQPHLIACLLLAWQGHNTAIKQGCTLSVSRRAVFVVQACRWVLISPTHTKRYFFLVLLITCCTALLCGRLFRLHAMQSLSGLLPASQAVAERPRPQLLLAAWQQQHRPH